MARDGRPAVRRTGPGLSARREDGMRDALTGRPRNSNDRHYGLGYELGSRLCPEGPVAGRAGRAALDKA